MDNQSSVSVLYGSEGIRSVYESCLNAKRADFMCTSAHYEAVIGEWYDKEFAPKLFGSTVATREIVEGNEANRAYATTKAAKNQVRFVDSQFVSETDIVLWDGKAALVSYDVKQPMAVLITDGEVARALHQMFGALWEKLGE